MAEDTADSILRVTGIEVHGLFGLYTHLIDLERTERVAILHGPNGVGKTTLLRMVDALCNGRYNELTKVRFKRFSVRFSEGFSLDVKPVIENEPPSLRVEVSLVLEGHYEGSQIYPIPEETYIGKFGALLTGLEGTPQTLDSIVARGATAKSIRFRMEGSRPPEPPWLSDFRKRIRISLIETQRLMTEKQKRKIQSLSPVPDYDTITVPTVIERAKELARIITLSTKRYAAVEQDLNKTALQRQLDVKTHPLDITMLKQRTEHLDAMRARLLRLGLLGGSQAPSFDPSILDRELDQGDLKAATLYVDDTEKKFEIFDSLADQIELFLRIINDKFQHKRICIDPEQGFIALGEGDQSLDLKALSSGEQHELLLAHHLLFTAHPNSFVMIDEPELSLHITWQRALFPDLLDIVRIGNFDILLATHSASIGAESIDPAIALSAKISA